MVFLFFAFLFLLILLKLGAWINEVFAFLVIIEYVKDLFLQYLHFITMRKKEGMI